MLVENAAFFLMKFRNTENIQPIPEKKPIKKVVQPLRMPVNMLEYEFISKLVVQQYQNDNEVRFDLLLSIPVSDRIPALAKEFGIKRMYQLVALIVKAFMVSQPIPTTKKLNETQINVCACDLILVAEEDQLGLEDLIVFFERANAGFYGAIKNMQHHQVIMNLLENYRQERFDAYQEIKKQQLEKLKVADKQERCCSEPKPISEILKQASVINMNKKMSG